MKPTTRLFHTIGLVAAFAFVLAACAHESNGTTHAASPVAATPAAPRTTAAPAGPTKTVAYYRGTSKVSLPNGQVVGEGAMLVRRTLDPSLSQIEEYVLGVATHGKRGTRQYRVIMKVNGNTFTMKDAAETFSGSGTLEGEPWKWTAWTSTSMLPNKMVIESKDQLVAGKLMVHKTVKAPDGSVRVTIEENYSPITKETFEQARTQALHPTDAEAAAPKNAAGTAQPTSHNHPTKEVRPTPRIAQSPDQGGPAQPASHNQLSK